VAQVLGGAVRDVRPGDAIAGFEADGRMVGTAEPGAAALFRARFAGGDGATVKLLVLRADGVAADGAAGPLWVDGKGRPPFTFETVRETGPPRGPGAVIARIGRFGWEAVAGLPREVLSSLRAPPTREEQGALLEAVREDPWTLLRLFAFVHAFLLFLNLVPIPPLDGFQLLCCLLEMAARRPLPRRGVAVAMRAGWVVLGLWLLLNAWLILRDLATSVI
jgi:hypothetical protein